MNGLQMLLKRLVCLTSTIFAMSQLVAKSQCQSKVEFTLERLGRTVVAFRITCDFLFKLTESLSFNALSAHTGSFVFSFHRGTLIKLQYLVHKHHDLFACQSSSMTRNIANTLAGLILTGQTDRCV